jgi:hypothetical protein
MAEMPEDASPYEDDDVVWDTGEWERPSEDDNLEPLFDDDEDDDE